MERMAATVEAILSNGLQWVAAGIRVFRGGPKNTLSLIQPHSAPGRGGIDRRNGATSEGIRWVLDKACGPPLDREPGAVLSETSSRGRKLSKLSGLRNTSAQPLCDAVVW